MTDKKEEILNKDDITQLHGAQILATKDGLINEAKKHADISQLYADSQAKERAIGFAQFLSVEGWISANGIVYEKKKRTIEEHYEVKTAKELYTEYEVFTKKNKG